MNKKPKECVGIEEIRECINSIDKEIISTLSRRFEYVKEASKFKKDEIDVKADNRVKEMLEQRRTWAQEEGLSPDFIESLFKKMVSYFIEEELITKKRESLEIERVQLEDLSEIHRLQNLAYIVEAKIYSDYKIPPLTQTLNNIKDEFNEKVFLKAVLDGTIIGSVRANSNENTCYIGKLIVHPECQNMGVGTKLLKEIEKTFESAKRFELFTGHKSEKNIYLYQKHGYRIFKTEQVNDFLNIVYFEK